MHKGYITNAVSTSLMPSHKSGARGDGFSVRLDWCFEELGGTTQTVFVHIGSVQLLTKPCNHATA